jgi:hypothetical protein
MATEPISTAYFMNPSHQSVCLYVYPPYRCKATALLIVSLHSVLGNGAVNTFPRQLIHATVEELLEASFLRGPCPVKGESVGLSVYPPIVSR